MPPCLPCHASSKKFIICVLRNIDCGGNALPLHLIIQLSQKFVMANCYDPKVACQKFSENGGDDGEEAGDR